MKRRGIVAFATATVMATALVIAQPGGRGPLQIRSGERNPWTHLDLRNRPQDFQFAIVSDRTGGHRPGVFPDALSKLNWMQPEFVMSIGDLIEGGTEDTAKIDAEWNEFNGFVDKLHMPFFYAVGNHDISNATMREQWERRFGATYYSFVYHDVLFAVLNSENIPGQKRGHIGDEQRHWLKELLDTHRGVRWTFIFVHKPMWQYGSESNWSEVEEVLGDRRRLTLFSGHHHRYQRDEHNGRIYYALATTGGASDLSGPANGRFDHVVWVTMTGDGPRIANLMIDGIWDDDPVNSANRMPKETTDDNTKAR